LPRSPHNPACPSRTKGYALYEALSSVAVAELAHEGLLVDRAGKFHWEPLDWIIPGYRVCPALEDDLRWRVVDWRYPDGSSPSGPADLTLVDFERCATPRTCVPSGMN
jgi:hypothetical protein